MYNALVRTRSAGCAYDRKQLHQTTYCSVVPRRALASPRHTPRSACQGVAQTYSSLFNQQPSPALAVACRDRYLPRAASVSPPPPPPPKLPAKCPRTLRGEARRNAQGVRPPPPLPASSLSLRILFIHSRGNRWLLEECPCGGRTVSYPARTRRYNESSQSYPGLVISPLCSPLALTHALYRSISQSIRVGSAINQSMNHSILQS